MDVETGEHPDDAPTGLVRAQHVGHRLAKGLVTVAGASERNLRHGVVQHPGTDGMTFGGW